MTARTNAELRSAYNAYVALFWQFYHLPADHPMRAILAEAVDRADARWRALTSLPVQPTGDRGELIAPVAPEAAHV